MDAGAQAGILKQGEKTRSSHRARDTPACPPGARARGAVGVTPPTLSRPPRENGRMLDKASCPLTTRETCGVVARVACGMTPSASSWEKLKPQWRAKGSCWNYPEVVTRWRNGRGGHLESTGKLPERRVLARRSCWMKPLRGIRCCTLSSSCTPSPPTSALGIQSVCCTYGPSKAFSSMTFNPHVIFPLRRLRT